MPRNGPDQQAVALLARGQPKAVQDALHKFAGWLWNTGTRDDGAIAELVRHRIEANPDSPYAFYAPDGETRRDIEARFREDRAEREKREHDAADATFLGQR